MRQTCWRRESELRSWNPDHEHDPPGYGVSSVDWREAVAPYLLRGLLLRLAVLVQRTHFLNTLISSLFGERLMGSAGIERNSRLSSL